MEENEWDFKLPETVTSQKASVKISDAAFEVYCESPELMLTKATGDSAGYDLRARENYTLRVGKTTRVRTGIFLGIPRGFVGKVHSRSGLSTKNGIVLVNGVGVIDSDYRGEVIVCLTLLDYFEHDDDLVMKDVTLRQYHIKKGDRIAQLLIERVLDVDLIKVTNKEDLGETVRGSGGFGSTGL